MRLTVTDFKSVKQVDCFRFAPLTMLAGVNSSGKTSLLQALLLLKQTLDGDSKKPLQLNGDYVKAESLTDLIYKKTKGTVAFVMEMDSAEISNKEDFQKYSPLQDEPLTSINLDVSFTANGDTHVKSLMCELRFGDAGSEVFSAMRKNDTYDVSFSNTILLGSNIKLPPKRRSKLEKCELEFTNFIPLYVDTSEMDGNITYSVQLMKDVLTALRSFFAKVEYLGPNRVEPVLAKGYDRMSYQNVGIHGENTRFILNQKKNDKVEGYDEILTQAVTRWMCQEMGMAKSFDVTRDVNMRYRTVVTNAAGSKVDLIHMGYGMSQVLPIIVQGLLTPVGGTFIVVDPEVHLHPMVQGKLVDFFIELQKKGRKVVVETHSDHIVTRLRRRVAEGIVSPESDINLCYVENNGGESLYIGCELDSQGTFTSSLPKGFMDTQDEDYKAIVRAKIIRP